MTTDLDLLPRPPCPWTFPGALLDCTTLNAPTIYRARYDFHPHGIDAYKLVCIKVLGGDLPGKVHSLPLCSDLDAAVARGLDLVGWPGVAAWVSPGDPGAAGPLGATAPAAPGGWGLGSPTGLAAMIGAPDGLIDAGGSGATHEQTGPSRPTGPDHEGSAPIEAPLPMPLPEAAPSLLAALALLAVVALCRRARAART